MAELPLDQGIPRFKQNEDRFDRFTNGTDTQSFVTSGGISVPSLRKFLKDTSASVNQSANQYFENSITRISEATEDAESARDDTLAALAAVQPTTRHFFEAAVGATFITIPGGYVSGTVAEVYINGLLLPQTAYTATNGSTVSFSAITSADLAPGDTTATIEVFVGTGIVGFTGIDARYNRRVATTSDEIRLRGDGDPDGNWAKLMNASEDGRPLIFTKPPVAYAFDDEIFIDGPAVDWTGFGYPEFRNERPAGTYSKNIAHIKSPFSQIRGIRFNGQADTKGFIQPLPLPSGSLPAHGHNLIVGGDYSVIENIITEHAQDNGCTVGSFNVATGLHDRNPLGIKILNSHAQFNGEGEHEGLTPGRIGAGFSSANGKQTQFSNLTDYQSYVGFIADVGAGAQVDAVNCSAWATRRDTRYDDNGSGFGFYAGAADCNWLNCASFFAENKALWADGPRNNYVNFRSVLSQREGIWLKGNECVFTNLQIDSPSQSATNIYDALFVEASADMVTYIDGLRIGGTKHRYGFFSFGDNNYHAMINGVTNVVGHVSGDFFSPNSSHRVVRYGFNLQNKFAAIGLPTAAQASTAGELYRDTNGFLKTV